jgi:hypothetical protein
VCACVGINGDKHPLFSIKEIETLDNHKLKAFNDKFFKDWNVKPFYFNADAHSVNICYMNGHLKTD